MRRWVFVAMLLGGCTEPDEDPGSIDPPSGPDEQEFMVEVGEHVELRYLPHIPMCSGELARFDAHVRQASELLGVELPSHPLIYHWGDAALVEGRCPPGSFGCVRNDAGWGLGLSTGFHELNHLIAARVDGSIPLWGEGIATALEPEPTHLGRGHLDAMLEVDALDLEYSHAGHAVRKIWLEEGRETLLEITSDSSRHDLEGARALFKEVMGVDLKTYGDRLFDEGPETFGRILPAPETLPWTGERWVHELELDCDAPHTRYDSYGSLLGHEVDGGMIRYAHLAVEHEGRYELQVSEGVGLIWPVGSGGEPPADMEFLIGGDTEIVHLPPGLYEVGVLVGGLEPRRVVVELRPRIGPVPIDPE